MSENEAIRQAADALACYAAQCYMRNTLDWMEGLETRINDYLAAVGHTERVIVTGNGLVTVTPDELSTLDSLGYLKR